MEYTRPTVELRKYTLTAGEPVRDELVETAEVVLKLSQTVRDGFEEKA